MREPSFGSRAAQNIVSGADLARARNGTSGALSTAVSAHTWPVVFREVDRPNRRYRTRCDCETPGVSRRGVFSHVYRLPAGVTIRPEQSGDRSAIAGVVAAAFGSSREARLVEAIRASANFVPELSLVAEVEGRIVGHVMVSFVALRDGAAQHRVASLSPLAVAPAFQRRGIGSALVREVTTRTDDRGEPLVVLEGSPAFYGRLGFEHSVPYGIEITLPSWAPPGAAQVLRLRNYDTSIRGRLVYPPAFDTVAEQ
jgi:putative acetyltransferase